MRRISVFGSTGSIGSQTLDVLRAHPELGRVTALVAGKNMAQLKTQLHQFQPEYVAISDEAAVPELRAYIQQNQWATTVISGPGALLEMAHIPTDLAVMAIPGTVAIHATASLMSRHVPIALASKEVLVSAGQWIMGLARTHQVPIYPIDSEHSAIAQCLETSNRVEVSRLVLTASGGPFRNRMDLSTVTLEDALQHPRWVMGPKVTVDSSTLMNKGLEVIEAHHLFNVPLSQIDVVVHPESIVHGMVEFCDGQWVAHLSGTDMHYPIQHALSYPTRLNSSWPRLAWPFGTMTFELPDYTRFPLLQLAIDCGHQGGSAPAVLNAANEAMVTLFLNKKCGYLDISNRVRDEVDTFQHCQPTSIDDIVNIDSDVKYRIYNSIGV